LRESLKEQVAGLLTRRLGAHSNGNPLAAIGAMIGVAFDRSARGCVCHAGGVAALLNGMPPRGDPGERAARAPAAQTPRTSLRPRLPPANGTRPVAAPTHAPRNRRKLQRAIAASTSSSSRTSTAPVTRVYSANLSSGKVVFTWKLAAVNLNE